MPVTSAKASNAGNTILFEEKLKEHKETIDQMDKQTKSVIAGANAASDEMLDKINNGGDKGGSPISPSNSFVQAGESESEGVMAQFAEEPKKRDKPKVSYAPPANNNISTATQSKVTSPIGTAKPSAM